MKEGGQGVGKVVKALQDAMLRMRYANVPVVAAIRGIALDGRVAAFDHQLAPTIDRDAHRALACVDRAGGVNRILACQCVLEIGEGKATLCEGFRGYLDEDLLWLIAKDYGLFNARGGQKHVARLDRVFLQLRIAVAVAGE